MSVSRVEMYDKLVDKMNDVRMYYIIYRNEAFVDILTAALTKMPRHFAKFDQNKMEDIAGIMESVAEPLEVNSKAKTQFNDIVSMLFALYAQFDTVFLDIKTIAESLGQPKYMSEVVTQMNICGNFWVTCKRYGKIDQDSAENLFKIMTYVVSTLQKDPRLQGNQRVVYMRNFLYTIYEEIPKIKDGKNKYLMFRHVKRLMGPYDPPASNLETTHAEATPVVADLKPQAELTDGSVRIAGLLCELSALRA